jgi:hypothetical protein
MSRILVASCVGFALIAAHPSISVAQVIMDAQSSDDRSTRVTVPGSNAIVDSARTYDSLALRLETHMGEFRIIRGLNGPEVGHIGMFTRVNLERLVATSDNATREAREFDRSHGPGMLAGVSGLVIFGVAIAASSAAHANWGLTTATVSGAVLMTYGAVRLDKAYRSLSKAIWWYNRDLK